MNVARQDFAKSSKSKIVSSKELQNSNPNLVRVPPHSYEAEESVLGGILIDNFTINSAMEILKPEDFYKRAHSEIFKAMVALTERGEPIDAVTLSEELKKTNILDECGGLEMISRLASSVPSAANVIYYANMVKSFSIRRTAIHEASEVINNAYDTEKNLDEFIDETEQRILSISDEKTEKSFTHIGDIAQDALQLVERLYDKKKSVTGVSSGFSKLDDITAGFQKASLFILAARPGVGKTALALTFAQNVALREELAVGIFSLEMSKEELFMRMLSSEARVSNSKLKTGKFPESDFPKIVEAASRLTDAPIYIDDTGGLTITELKAKARRLAREKKLGLIIVDYLQLMRSPTYKYSREQEIADISRSLKGLAKELNIPIIALSQLNRSVEGRDEKRPRIADLRESGAIEQDADIIAFIYRDEMYNPDTKDKGIAEIILGKHRAGPTGTVRVAFSGEYTRFDQLDESGITDEFEASDYEQENLDINTF
ncbi:MAG: replicative DNA helicase [Bdellovibrionota bacterium]|nr:replicative DNA helicase [Pseudomonadota bacterium]MDY6090768.1 replicative DNA helicase [Bdellovibrionota bacterium]